MKLKLKIQSDQQVWISSDFHFGHTNIAGKEISKWPRGYRTFSSVHEMNKEIVNRINEYVAPEDILFFLGDFSFNGSIQYMRDMLNVETIHFIMGNHDHKKVIDRGRFTSVNDAIQVKIFGSDIFMSHYAHRVWPGANRGCYHFFGHSHGALDNEQWGKSMDIGIDSAYKIFGEYRPFNIVEALDILHKKQKQ